MSDMPTMVCGCPIDAHSDTVNVGIGPGTGLTCGRGWPVRLHGIHLCEDCDQVISDRDIEGYSIECDGIGGYDETTKRFIPRTISIPAACSDCADKAAAGWGYHPEEKRYRP